MSNTELALSQKIENLLVAHNLWGMKNIQPVLTAGYCLRAAQMLRDVTGTILIGSGILSLENRDNTSVIAALSLYNSLLKLGADPVLVSCHKMAKMLSHHYQVLPLNEDDKAEIENALARYSPQAVISIERPELSIQGCYTHIDDKNSPNKKACFGDFMKQAKCPTIAIGDGGNELRLNNINERLTEFDIIPAAAHCDELVIADLSLWGVYGILAFLGLWKEYDLLADLSLVNTQKYLSSLTQLNVQHDNDYLIADSEIIQQIRRLLNEHACLNTLR